MTSHRVIWILCLAVVAVGVIFRCINIDRKVYWVDETYASLRVAGYRFREVEDRLFTGRDVTAHDVQKYQHFTTEKGFVDSIASTAIDTPDNGPLPYFLTRLWATIFGDSISAIRSLSVIWSLLLLPVLYFLCREIFASTRVAQISLILIAVSPFHVLYAQEARPYSLWTLLTVVSTLCLWQAIRLQNRKRWYLYAATVSVALYVHPLSAMVMAAHLVFVAAFCGTMYRANQPGWKLTLKHFSFASLVALVVFLPWIFVVIFRWDHIQMMHQSKTFTTDLIGCLQRFLLGPTAVFVDPGPQPDRRIMLVFGAGLIGLMIWGLFDLARRAPRPAYWLVVSLFVVPLLMLVSADLVTGGSRSLTPRYATPCYVGLILAVAQLVAARLDRLTGRVLLVALISLGMFSCWRIAQADTWWNKRLSARNPAVAQIINAAANPLVISDSSGVNFGNLMSLSHSLQARVQLRLSPNPPSLVGLEKFSDVFVYSAPETWNDAFRRQGHEWKPLAPGEILLRLQPTNRASSPRSPAPDSFLSMSPPNS